jgi:hypothetical protein
MRNSCFGVWCLCDVNTLEKFKLFSFAVILHCWHRQKQTRTSKVRVNLFVATDRRTYTPRLTFHYFTLTNQRGLQDSLYTDESDFLTHLRLHLLLPVCIL